MRILDRHGKAKGTLRRFQVRGTVTGNLNSAPGRTLALTVVDPEGHVRWLPDSPSDAGLYGGRQLQVVADMGNGVRNAIFTGPIWDAERKGAEFQVRCKGREMLGLDPFLSETGYTAPIGERAGDAITHLFDTTPGLAQFSIEHRKELKEPVTLERFGEAWRSAEEVATQLNLQLYFDGWGELRIRKWPKAPAHVFKTGPKGTIKDDFPAIIYSSEFHNRIVIQSPDPCGGPPVEAIATSTGDLRPEKVGLRIHVEEIEGLTQEAAQEHADEMLVQHERRARGATFQAVPDPTVELGNALRVNDPYGDVMKVRLESFSFQLPIGEPMSIGTIRRGPLGRN